MSSDSPASQVHPRPPDGDGSGNRPLLPEGLASSASHRRPRPVNVLAGAIPAAITVVALVGTDTPFLAIVQYAAYLLFAVLVPGTAVHRALRGRSPLLVADLALGAATGLALELIAWAVFTRVQAQSWLWAWPLAVIGPFLAVPALRRHWWSRQPGGEKFPPFASWLLAAALSYFLVVYAWLSLRPSALAPQANLYNTDVYWHLGIAAELTRQVPPEVPQVAGRTLHYHWFSNAHIAASHLISGVDLHTVMLRLWLIPLVAIVLGLIVAVTGQVTRAAWAGAVAAVIVVAPAQLIPWQWFRPFSSTAMTNASPSQVFGLVFLLLAAHVLIDLVRGTRIGRGWVVLALAVCAAPGSKPAVLPALLGGLLLVLVLHLIRGGPVRRVVGSCTLILLAAAVSSPLVAQSAAGSGLKLLGFLVWSPPWNTYTGARTLPGTGGHVVAGLGSPGSAFLALLLVAAFLLQYAWLLAALPLLRPETRTDSAVWLLAGAVIAGLVATFVVDHPGASEVYFAQTITPLAAILAASGSAAVFGLSSGGQARRRTAAVLAISLGLAAAVVSWAERISPEPEARSDIPTALARPLAGLLLGAAVGAAAWLLLRRRWRGMAGSGATLACAVLVWASLVQSPPALLRSARAIDSDPPAQRPEAVSSAEATAARWLARHSPARDVVATNVHCRAKVTRPACEARAFWVSALSERRVLVEGWAYTEETLLQQGRGGRGFVTQPFDDPALLATNDGAFTEPTAAGLAELRERHRVRWLFADRRAGPVSPTLARLAVRRFSNADVQLFWLR